MKDRVSEIFGIKYPIIQGPMAWLTDAKMVAAISNAGGMGTLGPNAGQTTITADVKETGERLRKEIRKVRELTDKPFAVNYLYFPAGIPGKEYSEIVLKVSHEEKVDTIVAVGDLDMACVGTLKRMGFKVVARPSTPTVENARLVESAGADVIVATGFDEGGGMPGRIVGTMAIIPEIVDTVSIPVIGAGGIVDKRTAKAVSVLGAEGVYVGTRFIVTEECPAHPLCKQAIINAKSEDLITFITMPTYLRSTPTKIALQAKKMEEGGATREKIAKTINMSSIKLGMLDYDLDHGVVAVSNGVGQIKSIKSAKEIVDELASGFDI
jgi:enoyl-[acyl-carrier protein] reductase II